MATDSIARTTSNVIIRCGLSTAFLNKENLSGKRSALGYSFNPSGVPVANFIKHVLSGRSWTPGYFKGNTRRNETFISSELIALDFDNNVSVADVLAIPAVQQYAMLVHPSPSSSPECYKTRVVFRLSEPVEGVERYRTIARAWAEYIGLEVDPASWKPAQPYYGSTNRIEQPHVNIDALLDVVFVGSLTADLATDDYLRETTRLTYTAVDLNSPRAEKYAAATVQGAISDYLALPSGAGIRHDAFIKLAARLIGMKLGGWPGLENVETAIRDAGRSSERTEREIEDAITWAQKTVDPIPLELPEDSESENQPQDTPTTWFTALPDSWRRALLNYFRPSTAPLMELFFQAVAAGEINPDGFTLADLLQANVARGFGISQPTLYRGVEELNGVFFSKFPTIEPPQANIVCNFEKNSARGRQRASFSLLPYAQVRGKILEYANPRIYERAHESEEGTILARPRPGMVQAAGVGEGEAAAVAAELDATFAPAYQAQDNKQDIALKRAKRKRSRLVHDLDNWDSTPLPEGWPLGSARDYRAAFLHAVVKADPDAPRSRSDVAEMTGVDQRSVTTLRQRAGVEAESQKKPVEVQSFDDIRSYGKQNRAFAKSVVAKTASGVIVAPAEGESYAAFITRQRAVGARVYAHFQHTSTYRVIRETPPEAAERRVREHTSVNTPRLPEQLSEPKQVRHYGPSYDPTWVMRQLRQALRLLGWQRNPNDGRLVNPDTHEYAPDEPRQIIELLIGRPLQPPVEVADPDAERRRSRCHKPPGDGWRLLDISHIQSSSEVAV